MIQQEIKGSNRTAIIATHDLLDVSQLCHRAVAMEKGKIIADGSPQETTRLMGLEIQSLAGASA
jgi:ABC-2 type transport system ATP-binding protein